MYSSGTGSQRQLTGHAIPRKPVPAQNKQPGKSDSRGLYLHLRRESDPHDGYGNPHTQRGHGTGSVLPIESSLSDNAEHHHQQTPNHEQESQAQEESLLSTISSTIIENSCEGHQSVWLPATLRLPYLLALILISIALAAVVALLTWYSAAHMGIGNDTNSTVLLFGWRFSPTLIAVIYVLAETLLLVDVRRTETFARLSKNSTSSASATISHEDNSWWSDPRRALQKQHDGGWRGWALFWTSIANILGMFVVSPLSAGFLSTSVIEIATSVDFSRIASFYNSTLVASADDTTYFRSIASSSLGLATSAWLSDQYSILPFWPSYMESAQLGAIFSVSAQSWHANTTVFQVTLDCHPMWLSEAGYRPGYNTKPPPYSLDLQNYTQVPAYTSIQLTSDDGCIYEFANGDYEYANPALLSGIFVTGGGWWSRTSGHNYPAQAGTVTVASSSLCKNREIFFVTSPFNNASTKAMGQVCSSTYFKGDVQATVVANSSYTSVSFDEALFEIEKRPMPASFDVASFELLFNSAIWSTKFQPPTGGGLPLTIGGPLLPIAALNDFNAHKLMTNPDIVAEATATKQRFLGEALQNTFASMTENTTPVSGKVSTLQNRVVVNFAVGVMLATVLFGSCILFVVVLFCSRPEKRPLGVGLDPSSAAAVTTFIAPPETRSCFTGADNLSKRELDVQLSKSRFRLRQGRLMEVGQHFRAHQGADDSKANPTQDWRPSVLRFWSGASAIIFLLALASGIISLFIEASRDSLYETAFVYQKSFSMGRGVTANIAPYSIIPTLFAVFLKLWWGALEGTFKRLQPYTTMAKRPTRFSESVQLSYINCVMFWASWKAFNNKHWLLALITLGTFLTEVFTVAISALWSLEFGTSTRHFVIARQLEIRTVPQVFVVPQLSNVGFEAFQLYPTILSQVYGTVLNTWLYSGLVDIAFNGSEPYWTSKDGWAFAPVDLSEIEIPQIQNLGSSSISGTAPSGDSPANVTTYTPGIRARLECTEVNLSNTSAWIQTLDFTNHSQWDTATLIPSLKTGYSLSADASGYFPINSLQHTAAWDHSQTTFFVANDQITCCANKTQGVVGRASIGYWSMNGNPEVLANATNFTVKWIVGNLYPQRAKPLGPPYALPYHDEQAYTVWQDIPKMTALNCMPIYETAECEVTVDMASSSVQSYQLATSPANATAAWSDDFYPHQLAPSKNRTSPGVSDVNVTVSYGWLFLKALLVAADSTSAVLQDDVIALGYSVEDRSDRTFNFRQTGLNVDFMSYAALALVEKDIAALLDADKLFKTSSHIFSTFFQHFVAVTDLSTAHGSAGFQSINATLPPGFTPPYALAGETPVESHSDTQHLSSTVNATLQYEIEELQMSPIAVYLCLSILAFLLCTTIWVFTVHRQHFTELPRDVDSLASIIGFVYASPRLQQFVEDHKHEKDWGLGKGKEDPMAKMGWFGDHYGIELVDDREGLHEDGIE